MTLEFQSITTAFAKIMGKAAEISNVVVFLDRDGVINEERGYVHRLEDFVFLPGAIAGMRLLCEAGYRLVVVTNQAGIAKGYYESGKLGFEAPNKNGKIEGIEKGYYESGTLQTETPHKDGKREGIEKVYRKNGKIVVVQT